MSVSRSDGVEGLLPGTEVVVATQCGRSVDPRTGVDFVTIVLTLVSGREAPFAVPRDIAKATSKQLAHWADVPPPISE